MVEKKNYKQEVKDRRKVCKKLFSGLTSGAVRSCAMGGGGGLPWLHKGSKYVTMMRNCMLTSMWH